MHGAEIDGIAFTPDGLAVVTGDGHGIIRIWDVRRRSLVTSFPADSAAMRDLVVSADGETIASLADDRAIRTWSLPRRPPAERGPTAGTVTESEALMSLGIGGPVHANVSFDRQRQLTVVPMRAKGSGVEHPGFARIIDLREMLPIGLPLRHARAIASVAVSSDGSTIATGGADSQVRVWDAHSGKLRLPPLSHSNYVSALAFSPDGTILASGDYAAQIMLWDLATGRLVRRMPMNDIVLRLSWAPDGRTLVAGSARDWSNQPRAVIWNVGTGRMVGEPMRHGDSLLFVAHSPDGRTILTAANDHVARLWDAATGKPISPLLPQPKGFAGAAFATSGGWVIIADREGTLRRWDIATGNSIGKIIATDSQITALGVHPSDQLIATGDLTGQVRIWNLELALPVGPPELQHAPVVAAGFTLDGRALLTVSTHGDARRWPLAQPAKGDPDRLDHWLQAVTGLSMDKNHAVVAMEPGPWRSRRAELERHALHGDQLFADPGAADWHAARASDAEQKGDAFAAAWHLDRVLLERPDDWVARARRAGARSLLGNSQGAAEDEAELRNLGLAERETDWKRHRVLDHLQAGRWHEAIAMLDRLIATFPSELGLYIDRADCLARLGRYEESQADIARAIDHGADDPVLLYSFGVDRARHGQWEEADRLFARVRQASAVSIHTWVSMAVTALKASDRGAYSALCRQLWKRSEPLRADPMSLNNIAWCYALGPAGLTDYQPLIAGLEAAVAAIPRSAGAQRHLFLNTLGGVLYRAGRFGDAGRRLEEGIAAEPSSRSPEDYVFLAMSFEQLGRHADAARWLAKVPPQSQASSAQDFWNATELELLRTEAEALVALDPVFPADPFQP